VRLWQNAKRPRDGPPLRGHGRSVREVAFSPARRFVLFCGADGTLRPVARQGGRNSVVVERRARDQDGRRSIKMNR